MEKKTIGAFIAALRKVNGITQKELAEKLNVSDKAVSRWERDECAPDITLIPVIADIFGVTSDEILRGERRSDSQNDFDSNADKIKNEEKKSRLQLSNLINSINTKFLIQSIITVGINLVLWLIFIIVGSTLDISLSDSSSFMVAIIGTMIPLITETIFFISFLSSVKCYDSECNEILQCRNRNILVFEVTIGLITIVNSFVISRGYFLIPTAVLIGIVILHLIFRLRSLYVPLDKKGNVKDKAKNRLTSVTLIMLISAIAAGSLLYVFSADIALGIYSPERKELSYGELVECFKKDGLTAQLEPNYVTTDEFEYDKQHVESYTSSHGTAIGLNIYYSSSDSLATVRIAGEENMESEKIALDEGFYRILNISDYEENSDFILVDSRGKVRVKLSGNIFEAGHIFDFEYIGDDSVIVLIYSVDDADNICLIIQLIIFFGSIVMIAAIITVYILKNKKYKKA